MSTKNLGPRQVKASRFRDAANERWTDAQCLHAAARFDGAIYLCGYVLECFLKFVICERRSQRSIELREVKSHNLVELLDRSHLTVSLRKEHIDLFLAFQRVNAEWSVEMRYEARRKSKAVSTQFLRDTKDLRNWLQARLRR
jgi:hypothetical protein